MTENRRMIRENEGARRQAFRLSLYVTALFFILLMRLWYLQMVKTEDYQSLSESNRLRLVPVAAPRGAILDRNGKLLVGNRPSFSVGIIKQDVKDRDRLLGELAGYLELDRAELLEKWNRSVGRAKYVPMIVASGITQDQLEFLEENRLRLPGVDIEMKPVREYPEGSLGVHLLGYLGEIGEQELAKDAYRTYNPGDYVGKSGIEKAWEGQLHGVDGGRQLEVDARGRILRTVSEATPNNGNSLILTIDLDVQKEAEKGFGDQAGAAVALDVNTGEVLAFVSSPLFDPSLFTGKLSREQWQALLEDKRHPLENKALRGQYPPGSTFKIVTALAGLEEGLIDEHTTAHCSGAYRVGNRLFKCWDKHGHGTVNLRQALQKSCDVYFYQLAERLGPDKIAYYARKFGMGQALGIGLENEKKGLIPDTAWKEKKYGKKWLHGETLPVGIGQGYVLATPIQLASMIAAVANGGSTYKPYLVKKVVDQDGKVLQEFSPQLVSRTGISQRSLDLVKQGLYSVVNDPGGTGGAARLYEVKVAGKTGTSQVVKLRDKQGRLPYEYRDHALFVAFAPYDKPEIAVAVVVEHGEHGGGSAAPIAGRMLRAYFQGKGVIKKPVTQKSYSGARNEEPVAAEADEERKERPEE